MESVQQVGLGKIEMSDRFQPTEQALLKQRDIKQLIDTIEKDLLSLKSHIDNDYGGGFYKYYRTLFNLESMIENVKEHMLSVYTHDHEAVEQIVNSLHRETQSQRERLDKFCTEFSPLSQKNMARTAWFYEHYMKMNSEFQSVSGRYVIIAHAAAIVACTSALPSGWENKNFAVILLYSVYLFGFGIAISATSLFLKNILDARHENFYHNLMYNKSSTVPHRNFWHLVLTWIYIPLNSLSLLIFVGTIFFGISNLLQLKGVDLRPWQYIENSISSLINL